MRLNNNKTKYMHIRKKGFFLLIASFLMLLISSCEDYLTMDSKTQFDSDTVFESESTAEMAVEACYENIFNRELFYQFGMGTDCCFSTDKETNSKNQVGNYVYTTSTGPTGTYNDMYQSIEYCNSCLDGLEAMKATTNVNHLIGECYCIRALCYWNLVRYFGDVPYVTESSVSLSSFESSRVSRDTIYDGILNDLSKATELMQWKNETSMVTTAERFTKNSAFGLKARIALYAAGYSLRWDLDTYDVSSLKMAQRSNTTRISELYKIAADACDSVISKGENSLTATYEDVWRDLLTKTQDDEIMFEVGQAEGENSYGIGYYNGIYAKSSCTFGKSNPPMRVIPTYYFDFDENDGRRDVAICNYSIDNSDMTWMSVYDGNAIGKYRVDWLADYGTSVSKRNIDWPYLRYSDVLLMYAEALNEYYGAPTAEAVSAYEEVRTRAFGDASLIGTTPTSYDDFKTAIIKERKLELAFEGLRRTDLIRWNMLYSTLTQTQQDIISLAKREGVYANVPKYRIYQKQEDNTYQNDLVALDYTEFDDMTQTDSLSYVDQGYVVIDMFGKNKYGFAKKFIDDGVVDSWFTDNLYRGLVENQSELCPLNDDIIDVNAGLEGQQLPCY